MTKKTYLTGVVIFCIVGIVVFYVVNIRFVTDFRINRLIKNTFINLFYAIIIIVLVINNNKRTIKFYRIRGYSFLILPFLVAIINFPFSALIRGNAIITNYVFIPVLIINCFLIGLTEEFLFRIIINGFIKERFLYKIGYVEYILFSSGVFALFHILNTIGGAGVISTLIQVAYTFLLGSMFTIVYEKTYNIWVCIIIHAFFDFGGQIIPYLGFGVFQDLTFWILTTIIGICTFIQMIIYIYKKDKLYKQY